MTDRAIYPALIVTMLLWAGTFIGGRLLSGECAPAVAAFLRFAIASLVLIALVVREQGRFPLPPRSLAWHLLVLGASGVFAYNVCFFNALRHVTAGRASLFVACTPLVITCLSLVTGAERVGVLKIVGVLVSLTGTVLVISDGNLSGLLAGQNFGIGELALIGCVASWSIFTMAGKVVLKELTPLHTTGLAALVGAMLLLPLAVHDGLLTALPRLPWQVWVNVGYLGVFGTAVGFSIYYHGIERIGATRAGVFINLVPLFSVLLSWLLLGEAVHPVVLLGGALVMGGVALANFRRR